MKSFKLMKALYKYGVQPKQMMAMNIIFPVLGLIFVMSIYMSTMMTAGYRSGVEMMDREFYRWGYSPAGLYFGLAGIYIFQVYRYMTVAGIVDSSPLKRFLKIKAPLLATGTISLITLTLYTISMLIFSAIFCAKYPEGSIVRREILEMTYIWYIYSNFYYLFTHIYLAFCMHYFIPSMIGLFVTAMGWMFAGRYILFFIKDNIYMNILDSLGAPLTHFLVYAGAYLLLALSLVLWYLIALVMYRKPESKLAIKSFVSSRVV